MVCALIVLAGYTLLLGRGAAWLDAGSLHGLTPEQRATEIDAMRGYLIQAGAGILAFGALVYTALNFRLSREGHVTDRYTQAIEQLGSDQIGVRLGAIYALERIMIDSVRDHPTIVEVLAAYVREKSPAFDAIGNHLKSTRITTDVQAALTVLGRRPAGRTERGFLNLRRTNLAGADLAGADLTLANLGEADLTAANLAYAELGGAYLRDARVTEEQLRLAKTAGALLPGGERSPGYLPPQSGDGP